MGRDPATEHRCHVGGEDEGTEAGRGRGFGESEADEPEDQSVIEHIEGEGVRPDGYIEGGEVAAEVEVGDHRGASLATGAKSAALTRTLEPSRRAIRR